MSLRMSSIATRIGDNCSRSESLVVEVAILFLLRAFELTNTADWLPSPIRVFGGEGCNLGIV